MPQPQQPSVTRRQFLATASASAALAAVGPALAGTLPGPDRKPPQPKLGVQSYTFRQFKLDRAVATMNRLGLRYAEFFSGHLPLSASAEQRRAFLALCQDHDVTPVAFGVQPFTKDHAHNQRQFEFAKELGIGCLTADPTLDAFDSLDKLCAEYQIRIAIHPHGPVGRTLHRWYSAETIMAIVKNRHPLIGSCLDTGHLIRCAQLGTTLDPAAQVRVMGARNFGLHIKDHDNDKRTDVILGQAALRVEELLRALRDVEFDGFLSLEYEANPADPTADVEACLAVLRAAVTAVYG
ncbi:MAG TPA: sugar phosphate isomerase/epimerase [Gemmatales bacterium]|nr:sugar phosphate isomerase/epimerase [Gemmatales bacterium]HMP58017.1 sugar phosphate isomerase/epimerase [Gemmatales bacterium]